MGARRASGPRGLPERAWRVFPPACARCTVCSCVNREWVCRGVRRRRPLLASAVIVPTRIGRVACACFGMLWVQQGPCCRWRGLIEYVDVGTCAWPGEAAACCMRASDHIRSVVLASCYVCGRFVCRQCCVLYVIASMVQGCVGPMSTRPTSSSPGHAVLPCTAFMCVHSLALKSTSLMLCLRRRPQPYIGFVLCRVWCSHAGTPRIRIA